MASHLILRLVLCWLVVRGAVAAAPEPPDEMLSALEAGGATRAAVCAAAGGGGGGGGCRAALWARRWLLARASCLRRAGRAFVLLHGDPEDCNTFLNDRRPVDALEAVVVAQHPLYAPRAADEADWPAPPPLGPHDAALVLLASPAPPPRAGNLTTTVALLPQLASWLSYMPLALPGTQDAPPRPAPHLDLAQLPWLDSPMRVLALTTLLPPALMLAVFALVMNWPLRSSGEAKEVLIDCDMQDDDEV